MSENKDCERTKGLTPITVLGCRRALSPTGLRSRVDCRPERRTRRAVLQCQPRWTSGKKQPGRSQTSPINLLLINRPVTRLHGQFSRKFKRIGTLVAGKSAPLSKQPQRKTRDADVAQETTLRVARNVSVASLSLRLLRQ